MQDTKHSANERGVPGKQHYFAHTAPDRNWEPLAEHLQCVAKKAAEYACAFASAEWAELAGAWHDLGKYSIDFQNYLAASAKDGSHVSELRGTVDHSSAGAQWAIATEPKLGMIMAHVIAGHHAGLLNYDGEAGAACLRHRLTKDLLPWQDAAPAKLLERKIPRLPHLGKPDSHQHAAFRVSFWIRMLFSALVDADFLATEMFMNREKAALRATTPPFLSSMQVSLNNYLADLSAKADDSEVNKQRSTVLASCRARAHDSPGFFSLCVPTGGGKTLASLAFALDHAEAHGLRRVVVAVPFTSIIEQNADEYRKAFKAIGKDVVLEHHSNLDPERETDQNRLQSENWDAPLVVTTNVQLFESLFACRTSRCRKLHRLARSVIVLDEVQALPVDLLKPTLWALRELVEVYGCTVVLCTATQPAFEHRADFPIGIAGVRAIVDEPDTLYRAMRRTSVTRAGILTDDDLVERLKGQEQVLCIVNTRPHAARLSESLGSDEGHFHLSTRMCAAHRLKTLEKIRACLGSGKRCRVVSTQLVEAGVNLDFPIVYRAPCGLDSLAQAAGRCNREGNLERGEVVSFSTEKPPPLGHLRQSAQLADEILEEHHDPLAPETIEAYFKLYFWSRQDRWDHHKVLETVGNRPDTMRFAFRDMASRYRFIPEKSNTILVAWGEKGRLLIEKLRQSVSPDRETWRRLQRYTVQVHDHELCKLQKAEALELVHEHWVLTSPKHYDEELGLVFDARWEPEDLIV